MVRWERTSQNALAFSGCSAGVLIPTGRAGVWLPNLTMQATNDSHDTPARPTKDSPVCRGRDRRKPAQDDASDEQANNPPNHPTHGPARFLWEAAEDTPVSELGERYSEWCQDNGGVP